VAKDIRTYDEVARNMATQTNLLVSLEEEEKRGLVSEQDELRGQFRQIFPVILTVGCAAFLQGHVQASINCASLYAQWLQPLPPNGQKPPQGWLWQWRLGAMNSSPFFAAALIGAPSALLFNYWIGRRGAITVAAVMILASSLGSAWTASWWQLLCVRVVNGVGMSHRDDD
jgi:MFS family permease